MPITCPFCGELPDIDEFVYPIDQSCLIWQAGCTNSDCGAAILGDSRKHAIYLWNRRKTTVHQPDNKKD